MKDAGAAGREYVVSLSFVHRGLVYTRMIRLNEHITQFIDGCEREREKRAKEGEEGRLVHIAMLSYAIAQPSSLHTQLAIRVSYHILHIPLIPPSSHPSPLLPTLPSPFVTKSLSLTV